MGDPFLCSPLLLWLGQEGGDPLLCSPLWISCFLPVGNYPPPCLVQVLMFFRVCSLNQVFPRQYLYDGYSPSITLSLYIINKPVPDFTQYGFPSYRDQDSTT